MAGTSAGTLKAEAELIRGLPFPVSVGPEDRWWWKIYVDNFDVGEVVLEADLGELVGTVSLSQEAYRVAVGSLGIPLAPSKAVSRNTVGITMGSVIDGMAGRAAPTLAKLFDHLSLTLWLLSRGSVCRMWLQAAAGRWVFNFQHRRPCYAALDRTWSAIPGFAGWRRLPASCGDEFLLFLLYGSAGFYGYEGRFGFYDLCDRRFGGRLRSMSLGRAYGPRC